MLVVSRVHKNLIKDLVETRVVGDGAVHLEGEEVGLGKKKTRPDGHGKEEYHFILKTIPHPHLFSSLLDGANVGVWTQKNVLELQEEEEMEPISGLRIFPHQS